MFGVKKFDSIDKLLEYCRKNENTCRKNKDSIAENTAILYLKKAGYRTVKGKNLFEVYRELNSISKLAGINPGNRDYLDVRNKDIMDLVAKTSSQALKDFLKNNGHSIIYVPKIKKITLKEAMPLLDTVKLNL